MNEFIPWVAVLVNVIVMALGFSTMRREQGRDSQRAIEAAIKNENRLTRIEGNIHGIMRKLGMVERSE
jgi:hypothetical protein